MRFQRSIAFLNFALERLMSHCVWYVSKYVCPPQRGTAGVRGYLLMKELATLGHKVLIITSDSNQLTQAPSFEGNYLRESSDGIDLWWVKTLKYDIAKSSKRILSWLHFEWRFFLMPKKQLHAPDVLIISSLSLLTIINGFLLRRKYGCKLVFEIRDIWPLTLTEEGGFKESNPFVKALAFVEKLGYKYADLIVGTMPNLKAHVKHVLGYDRHVDCVPMGYEEHSASTALQLSQDFIDQYIPQDKLVVAHVGSIGITNALDTYFACAATMTQASNIHFLVVGDGDLKMQYETTYGHLANVTFAPKVSKELVPAVLAQCNLLYFSAHPSKVWEYGQSLNKVIDYMLSGKPILASYTGYPSMIDEAQCGTFVPAGDVAALREELLRLAALQPAELAARGTRGREWILANRSYKQLGADYLKIVFADGLVSSANN